MPWRGTQAVKFCREEVHQKLPQIYHINRSAIYRQKHLYFSIHATLSQYTMIHYSKTTIKNKQKRYEYVAHTSYDDILMFKQIIIKSILLHFSELQCIFKPN